jgi:hypothetical protein
MPASRTSGGARRAPRRPLPTLAAAPLLSAALLSACFDSSAPTRPAAPVSPQAVVPGEPTTEPGITVYGLGARRRATPQSPCASGAYRQFDFWVGDWAVSGAAGTVSAVNRVVTDLDGCAVEENWAPLNGPRGRSLNSYDAETGTWHQTWVPETGFPLRMAGNLRPDGVMAMTGTRVPSFAPNVTIIDAYTWTHVGADHVIQAFTTDVPQTGFHVGGQLSYERSASLPATTSPGSTACQPGQVSGETRLLDFTLGRWQVSAANGLALGTSDIALDPTLSGCLIEETFTTEKGYRAIGWMYYEPYANLLYRSSVDTEGDRLELAAAVPSGAAGPVVFEGAERTPGSPNARVRVTWTKASADELRQTWELSKDGGATWREVQSLTFTRL